MTGGSLKYLLKEGVRNLWTNRLMTFASVGVLTACLLIVGIAMLFSENVNAIVGYVEEQNEIVAFWIKIIQKKKINRLRKSWNSYLTWRRSSILTRIRFGRLKRKNWETPPLCWRKTEIIPITLISQYVKKI